MTTNLSVHVALQFKSYLSHFINILSLPYQIKTSFLLFILFILLVYFDILLSSHIFSSPSPLSRSTHLPPRFPATQSRPDHRRHQPGHHDSPHLSPASFRPWKTANWCQISHPIVRKKHNFFFRLPPLH